MMNNCIFCSIIEKKIPSKIIWQSPKILVIEDIAPKAPIHWLIIPKKHVTDICELHVQETTLMNDMIDAACQLSTIHAQAKDFRLVINRGTGAGQTVFHVHMHFLAGAALPGF